MKKTMTSANASDPAVEVDISHVHLNEAEAALPAIRFGRIETLAAMKADASDYMMKTSLARLVPALEWEMKESKIRAANQMAQEALTDSEERFRKMAENIRDVFYLRDTDGDRMLYISPAYQEIWGRSCESLYSNPKSWTEAIHQDDRTSTTEKYKQGISAGEGGARVSDCAPGRLDALDRDESFSGPRRHWHDCTRLGTDQADRRVPGRTHRRAERTGQGQCVHRRPAGE